MIGQHRLPSEEAQPAVTFSPMQREEVAVVLEIERLSYSNPWTAEFFLQELRLAFSKILLAHVHVGGEAQLAGYICRWLTEGELHILNVAVHPSWRRRSIGVRLVSEVIAEARRAGAKRAMLEVRRTNLAALNLYESIGFTRIGLRRDYYGQGEDAFVMELKLASC